MDSIRNLLPGIILIGLAVILIAIAFSLLVEPPAPIETLQEAVPVLAEEMIPTHTTSPTASATSEPTRQPTWTLQPSRTNTPTPTLTPTGTAARLRIPTLTPARPHQFNERYNLQTVDAELIDTIALTIADYPDAAFNQPGERFSAAYNAYFIYPYLAYREALLRFPDAVQVESWQWGMTYSMARLGDSNALHRYAAFLLQALEQDSISLAELGEWFHSQAPDLNLIIHDLDTNGIDETLKLLEIPEGQVVFLYKSSAADGIKIIPLSSKFNFAENAALSFTTLDVDGDGRSELVYYFQTTETLLLEPYVYNLSSLTPTELHVARTQPLDFKIVPRVSLHPVEEAAAGTVKQAQAFELRALLFPSCPLEVVRRYRWDGRQVIPQAIAYNLQLEPSNLSYCEALFRHAEGTFEVEARIEVEGKLLPFWPPETDPQGRPYQPEDLDELYFLYAVNLALNGQTNAAAALLADLSQNPNAPGSIWSENAALFRANLTTGPGLYAACQEIQFCDLRAALVQVLEENPDVELSQVVPLLQKSGVIIRANGRFDFDQDGEEEAWVVIRPRTNARLEFWILSSTTQAVSPLFVDLLEEGGLEPYWADPAFYPAVFQLKPRTGFRMQRLAESGFPILETVQIKPSLSTYSPDIIMQSESDLLDGQNPMTVRDQLLAAVRTGRFNCSTHNLCDRFRYILGLAYELSGDISLARDTYIELWWENSGSPLAAAARLKLLFISSTATPTATP